MPHLVYPSIKVQVIMRCPLTYLCFPKLCELLAQVSGVFLQTAEVKLHLQVVDAVHMGCIGRWRRHQSEGRRRRVSCQSKSGKRGSKRAHRGHWKKKMVRFWSREIYNQAAFGFEYTHTHAHTLLCTTNAYRGKCELMPLVTHMEVQLLCLVTHMGITTVFS